jgi:pyruvate carboxylase subunit B
MGGRGLALSDVSLRSGGLRGDDLAALAQRLDGVGFAALDAFGEDFYRAALEAGQDPWEELRQVRAAASHTPLRAAVRGQSPAGHRHLADDAVELFLDQASGCGVDVFRVFDPLNDLRNLRTAIAAAGRAGRRVEGALCFAVGPVHDLDRWRSLAGHLVELGADEIVIRDTSGLLTPVAVRELVPALREAARVPVSVHTSDAGGLATMACLAAADSGAAAVDTVLSPLVGSGGPPAAESVVAALAGGDRDSGLDLDRLGELRDTLRELLSRGAAGSPPLSDPPDSDVVRYQLPGLLLRDLRRQLDEHQAAGRLRDVLAEVPRVSEELGWPPLVTPVRQLVATQAVYNALGAARYATVSQELKEFLQGLYGRPPQDPCPEVRRFVLGQDEPISVRPADLLDPEVEPVRARLTAQGAVAGDGEVLHELLFPSLAAGLRRSRAERAEKDAAAEANGVDSDAGGAEETAQRAAAAEAAEVSEAGGRSAVADSPPAAPAAEFQVEVEGEVFTVRVSGSGLTVAPQLAGAGGTAAPGPAAPARGAVVAPMQGLIVKIPVQVGDQVGLGDVVAVLEAMKMQNDIVATQPGEVVEILVSEGDVVSPNQPLVAVG